MGVFCKARKAVSPCSEPGPTVCQRFACPRQHCKEPQHPRWSNTYGLSWLEAESPAKFLGHQVSAPLLHAAARRGAGGEAQAVRGAPTPGAPAPLTAVEPPSPAAWRAGWPAPRSSRALRPAGGRAGGPAAGGSSQRDSCEQAPSATPEAPAGRPRQS